MTMAIGVRVCSNQAEIGIWRRMQGVAGSRFVEMSR